VCVPILPPPTHPPTSAGVGRTGSFISVDILARRLSVGKEEVDVFSLVRELRLARERTVETPVSDCGLGTGILVFFMCCLVSLIVCLQEQYSLVHEALVELIGRQ